LKEKTLSVTAICEGTVIDHIQSGQGLRILRLMKFHSAPPITLGLNLKSESMGLKDLIKVEQVFLSPDQTAQSSLFSPQATVNVIQNYQITSKYKVSLPETIDEILSCRNPLCVTQDERLPARFSVLDIGGRINLRCQFCEKTHLREDLDD
jgi:aspartate carbamoyltransferase regulatory subunit